MSEVVYRQATREDFFGISILLRDAFDGLLKEHGFWDTSPFASSRLPPILRTGPFPWFEMGLKEDQDGFWVAMVEDELAGFTLSWVRGSLWYLAHLFVQPKHQGKDIGRNLMERAMQHGKKSNITNRALVTPAYNPVSISLYSRCGIYPREPVYFMEGPVDKAKRIDDHTKLKSQKSETFETTRRILSEIDEHCIGYPRDKNHEYFFSQPSYNCYIYSRHDDPVGYAYVTQTGRVGPAATVSKDFFKDVVQSALGHAAREEKASSVSLAATGSNNELMKLAFDHGMKIRDNYLFMSSKPFPNFSNYILYPTGAML